MRGIMQYYTVLLANIFSNCCQYIFIEYRYGRFSCLAKFEKFLVLMAENKVRS